MKEHKIVEVDLEFGRPTVEQARIRLEQALRDARSQKRQILKLIHGYGSTGKGGAIKTDVHKYLKAQKDSGKIRYYVPGDDFSPFDDFTREAMAEFPKLYKDKDYSKGNRGITLVIL